MNKIDRIKNLVELLNHYRDKYYNNQKSEISDFEYDQLYDELLSLEKEIGFVMATSPTQTVGYEVKSELIKVKHNHPMLSLDKTKDVDDVIKFLNGKDGVVMAKMDGLTCSLRYLNGELVSAETRGDGETGEDVLHCAKTIKNIPLRIECLDEVIVDGEIIIPYDEFERINSTLPDDKKYKNPRNLASGSIRQLDSEVASTRGMKFIAWKLVKGWMSCSDTRQYMSKNSFKDRLWLLDRLGFDVVSWVEIPSQIISNSLVQKNIELIQKFAHEAKHPIDGCVFGYDDVTYGDSLGATAHHLRSQLAFKFYDELYETKLFDIEWSCGKSGVLAPTAIFQTVQIDGCDISRALLHNISIIKKLGLTNHCTVKISKRHEIIPQVEECLQDGDSDIQIPKYCPVCGGRTEVVKENESEVLMCTNPNCSGKLLGKLKFFSSKPAMNIEGLSEATLEFLINKGWVKSFVDIYHLVEYKDNWQKCDGFGKKSVDKILDAIEQSRNIKLENFITALSIPNVGLSTAKIISQYFNGDFNEMIDNLHCTMFAGFDGIGVLTAKNIEDFMKDNYEMINNLALEMRFVKRESKQVENNPFNGKSVAVTGKLIRFTRDTINTKLESLGAKPASGVTAKTHYLINNDPTSNSSKNKKANELNIPIITEAEFLEMVGE